MLTALQLEGRKKKTLATGFQQKKTKTFAAHANLYTAYLNAVYYIQIDSRGRSY